jgi:hypothetical protein
VESDLSSSDEADADVENDDTSESSNEDNTIQIHGKSNRVFLSQNEF